MLKRANKGRELIADALRDKAAKGEDLPIEARSYLRGDSNLKLDPVSDFISTDDVEIGGSHTASSMGLINEGFSTSLENVELMDPGQAGTLIKSLVENEEIARLLDLYADSEGGGGQYAKARMNMIAERKGPSDHRDHRHR